MTRNPVTIVEIDRDVCSLSFGVSPCTASGTHCYNTWRTCSAPLAYDRTEQTIRFVKSRADLPLSWDAIPSVQSTSTAPTELNVGDVDASSGPLGKRAQATVTFQDHPTSDLLLDPYTSVRPFNPMERGTFWTKLQARWPYHKGRRVRILDGYLDQDPEDMVTREYLIDSIDGPDSSGRVTLRAVDPLRILDDKTSQAPIQSRGELAADLALGHAHLYVTGAALADYPASGTLRIENELIQYTSLTETGGVLEFAVLTRGSDGTAAVNHSAGVRVQSCLRFTDVNAWEVARDLIQTYASAAYPFIDLVQWEAEADQWLDGFIVSAVISEPTGLNTLLAELCRDAQFFIWWDERLQKILLRAVRPPALVPSIWTDNANIIAGTQAVQYKPAERISQVWYYYDAKDPTKSVTTEENYRKVRIRIDAQSESEREYDESAIKKVFSRWVRTDAIVTAITTRIINRYRTTPFYLTVQVDAKDRGIWTADVIDVSTRILTDFDGNPRTNRYQVISAEETTPGAVIKYVLQDYNFTARYGYYMADDAPDFADATEEEKLTGGWFADVDGSVEGAPGYEYQ
jgi:hypothetical protein